MSLSRVAVLVLATVSCFHPILTISLPKSLQRLEEMLEQKKKSAESSYDVDYVWQYFEEDYFKNDVGSAKAIQTIKEALNAPVCVDRNIEAMLNLFSALQNGFSGTKNIDELMRNYSPKAMGKCVEYMDDYIIDLAANDKDLSPKLKILTEGELFSYDWNELRSMSHIDVRSLAIGLRKLADGDKLNTYAAIRYNYLDQKDERVELVYNFKYIYRKFILLPCKHYLLKFEDLVTQAEKLGVKSMSGKYFDYNRALVDYMDLRPPEFQEVVFRTYYCKNIIAERGFSRDELLRLLAEEDFHKLGELKERSSKQ